MAPSPPSEKDMDALRHTVSSTISLITQFEESLTSKRATTPTSQANCLTPLQVSVTLIRAHTTKLSLLIISEPFTPTAIITVLRELSTKAVPVLLSAVEMCTPALWGITFSEEVNLGARRLLRELRGLLGEIPLEGPRNKDGEGKASSEHNLQSTGVVWEACDALLQLEKKGIAGVVTGKAQEYHDMIEDAISELRDWLKESAEGDEAEEEDIIHDDNDDDAQSPTITSNVDIMNLLGPPKPFPRHNTELHAQLDTSLKKLHLVKMLYKALIKRRLPQFPATSSSSPPQSQQCISTLDTVMRHLRFIQEHTDDLASAFYDRDAPHAKELLDACLTAAKDVATVLRMPWDDGGGGGGGGGNGWDEFTSWLEKWLDLVDR